MCAGAGSEASSGRCRRVPVCAGVGSERLWRVPEGSGVGSGGKFRRQVGSGGFRCVLV